MATRKFEWSQTSLIIGIFSLLAVGSWIGFDLYRALVKTTLPKVLQTQLLPLETSIDEATISNLKGRLQFTQETLNQVQSVPAEVPSIAPSRIVPSPIQATSSAVATSSAQSSANQL